MSSANVAVFGSYLLPSSIATGRDLSHLLMELERIDNEMTAAAVHHNNEGENQSESGEIFIPDYVREFLEKNEFSLDNTNDRSEIIAQLRLLKRKAPVVHMAFAAEADSSVLGELVNWFRDSVHPQTILVVGYQPALVAGAYIRTPNHIYDLSLRSAFKQGREKLLGELEALRGDK